MNNLLKRQLPDSFTEEDEESLNAKRRAFYSSYNYTNIITIKTRSEDKLTSLSAEIGKLKESCHDPITFFYEYFSGLRNQVDLRRECLKLNIDDYSDQLIENINKCHSECVASSKNIKQLEEELIKSENELNQFISEISSFAFDSDDNDDASNKIRDLNIKAEQMHTKLRQQLKEYQHIVFNGKEFKFEFKELKIEDLFGPFTSYKVIFAESAILQDREHQELIELCEFNQDAKFKLVYKTYNRFPGGDIKDFHKICDNLQNTLIIVKSNKAVFGGFTSLDWSGENVSKQDANAFIFSLRNKYNRPLKLSCSPGAVAIRCRPDCGPIFGLHDLMINDLKQYEKNCSSFLNNNYKNEYFELNKKNPHTFLSGFYKFCVHEMEVYQKC